MFGQKKPRPPVDHTTLFKFELGDEVKCKITGFVGIVVTRSEWYNKCIRYQVQPQQLKDDGLANEHQPFDEDQLDLVTAVKVAPPSKTTVERTGGPALRVSRPSIARR